MDQTHIHLILNHAPVAGVAFGILLLALSFVRRFESFRIAALIFFCVGALLTIPVFMTGEPAEDRVEGIAGVSENVIETHEESATTALTGMIVLGLASISALAVYARKREIATSVYVGIGLLSLVSMTLIGRTAYLGGQIRHTEIAATQQLQNVPNGASGAEQENDDND
jgi:uncharacterized membrane protein